MLTKIRDLLNKYRDKLFQVCSLPANGG